MMEGSILFSSHYRHELERDSISFPADLNGSRIRCLISHRSLVRHFGARDESLSAIGKAFHGNWESIRAAARDLIFSGRITPKGEVWIVPIPGTR